MAEPDSSPTHEREQTPAEKAAADEHDRLGDLVLDREVGNVPSLPPSDPPENDDTLARTRASAVTNRLLREKRWKGQAETTRNDMMATAKRQGMAQEQAQLWVYAELDRMYPPLGVSDTVSESHSDTDSGQAGQGRVSDMVSESRTAEGQIQGLNELPGDWPELPANASLGVEIGWVQANRLRIVEERAGRATVVRLDLALSPAPSWAALGWLETSIRSYAKYVDVVAKASGGAEDEGAVMKRERRSVDEVRALLAEMEEAAGVCPSCGKPF